MSRTKRCGFDLAVKDNPLRQQSRQTPRLVAGFVAAVWLCVAGSTAVFADWPTALHDKSRSGATSERLELPLQQAWVRTPPAVPATAWAGPDNRNIEGHALKDRANYDAAFSPVIVGNQVFYGSTVDHQLWCVDLETGADRWNFGTGAAIRLAPTVVGERVLCGSDDGYVYCLNRQTGRLLWKRRGGPREEWLLGRGEMMSRWPVRTSILVENNIAYFGAGLFPHEDVYLYAVNINDGSLVWTQDDISESDAGRNDLSPQGNLLASDTRLFVPSGRSLPQAVDLKTGELQHKATANWRAEGVVGGTRGVLADGKLYSLGEETILAIDQATGKNSSWFPGGRRMVVQGEFAYVTTGTQLVKLHRAKYTKSLADRKRLQSTLRTLAGQLKKPKVNIEQVKQQITTLQAELKAALKSGTEWSVPVTSETALIATADAIVAGGNGRIDVLSSADGSRKWNALVEGDVHTLAMSAGHLIAGTSTGKLYAFGTKKPNAVTKTTPASPFPTDKRQAEYNRTAASLLQNPGSTRGFCLLLGAEEGRLAYALATQSELRIFVVEPDANKATAVRKKLLAAGLYGHRVSVLNCDYAAIPYSNYFANLVVSDTQLLTGTMPTEAANITRFVKPIGGQIVLSSLTDSLSLEASKNWNASLQKTDLPDQSETVVDKNMITLTRGRLPGAADWSHQYGGPGNTASVQDQRIKEGLGVLWFGDPGPGKMINRHEGAVGPLSVNGRLICQGETAVMAYDAYNGLFLWERENPTAVRTGVFQNYNPGNLVASEDSIFIMVRDKVLQLNQATGKLEAEHLVPEDKRAEHEWGYIAYQDGLLFGTATIRKEIAARNRRRGRATEDATDGIFAIDVATGKHAWSYQGKSIAHHTIAIGPSRVFFIDSTITSEQRTEILREDKSELQNLTPAEAKIAEDRMKNLDARTATALNARTGKVEWSKAVDVTDCSDIGIGGGKLTLMYQNNTLVLCGANANGHYWRQFIAGDFSRRRMVCLSAEDGHKLWSKDANYRHRPIIIGEQIIAEPWSFDLYTGEQKMRMHPLTGNEVPWSIIRPGHHCGMLTGSANMLMFRSGYTGFYDLTADNGTRHFAGHRLGCWINAIPAGGLVMIPEASAGCVCQFSIASTIVLEPRSARRPWTIISAVGATTPVKRMALNFGAPGDRADATGNIWLAYPRINPKKTTSLDLPLSISPVFAAGGGYDSVNENAVVIKDAETEWLFSSWARGLQKCSLPLLGKDDEPAVYTVRLHFADVPAHTPKFNIRIQGQEVETDITPSGPNAITREYKDIKVTDNLTIEFTSNEETPTSKQLPIVNALEVVRQD